MYVLLAWFASDNIMGWLASPILFYPLILIGCGLLAAFNLGLMPVILGVVVPQAKGQINGLLAMTPIPFRV